MTKIVALVALLAVLPEVAAVPLPPGVAVQPDIAYASPGGVVLLLDAYLRRGPGPHPAVVFVHGGGWTQGNRRSETLEVLLPALTAAGYTVFSADYRLAPQHPYPAAVDDVRRAIRFVIASAAAFRVDPQRIAVAGSSAGGHLASLVGTTPCPAQPLSQDPVVRVACTPRTVVNFFGPTDLRGVIGLHPAVSQFLGVSGPGLERVAAEASPITHVGREDPPQLLMHGTADAAVPLAQSQEFVEAAARAGMTAHLVAIPGGGHGFRGWDTAYSAWTTELLRWLGEYDR